MTLQLGDRNSKLFEVTLLLEENMPYGKIIITYLFERVIFYYWFQMLLYFHLNKPLNDCNYQIKIKKQETRCMLNYNVHEMKTN